MEQRAYEILIRAEMTAVINYALQQNRVSVVREIVLENPTDQEYRDGTLHIWSEPAVMKPFSQGISVIPANGTVSVKDVEIVLDHEFLATLVERVVGRIHIALEVDGKTASELEREFICLAFDEWHGSTVFPELLTAFVLPNHPEIVKINAKAAELMETWSGDPSLDAYQTRDPNRVRMQAAAVYGALQAQNIVYAVPPASFEAVGQRVRLCDSVIQQKMGTCLDLSLLYAACLEAIGLHPLLFLQPGHIFAGIWLEELTFPESVQDDPSLVTKRLADGVNEIAVVECTAFTAGKGIDFEGACLAAVRELKDAPLEYLIDVSRARLSGIRPLPLRVDTGSGWEIVRAQVDDEQLTAAPSALGETVFVAEGVSAPVSKLAQWERKLLELGLRNTLINLRLTQSVIPILSPSLSELEDALADGSEYGIAARPAEWTLDENNRKNVEKVTDLGHHKALIQSEFQNKRLRAALGEGDLGRAIVNLYRSAKTSLEENGANTLYLALGLLRWYETKSSQKARYAPVVLLPVEIVRKSALKGYVIRLRDEEPQMNITLLEMLKQDFGITVGGLDPLPQDEHGIDIRGVMTVLRKAVMDRRGWDVLESAFLGIFSFSQFVMWNDVRNRADDLRQNKIVKSLMEGKLSWDAQPMELDVRVPEEGVLLPISADASQLYAIEAAERGESFVLHGPPGTGKSQTITAMIANALAQGKTVLFVAEKMAALSVVQRRLEAIGLGPFCLELHSNKSKKRDVLEQLRLAAEVTRLQSAEVYEEKAEQIKGLRQELDAYAKALHTPRTCGLSVFELVNGYERHHDAPDDVHFLPEQVEAMDRNVLERQRLLLERLVAAGKAVGHPHKHPLAAVSLTTYSQALRSRLPDYLDRYQAVLDRLEQAGEPLSRALAVPVPDTLDQWSELDGIAKSLAAWFDFPRAWAGYENISQDMHSIREMARHYQKAGQLAQTLLSAWRDSFFQQDGAGLLTRWQQASGKWFLPKLLEERRLAKEVQAFSVGTVNRACLGQDFETLVRYQKELELAQAQFAVYGVDLDGRFTGLDANWAELERMAEAAAASAKELAARTGGEELRRQYAVWKKAQVEIPRFLEAYADACATRNDLYALLDIREGTSSEEGWIHKQRLLCRQIAEHMDDLREWTLWNHTCEEAASCGLAPVVEAYRGGLAHDDVEGAYFHGLYQTLIEVAVDQVPVLQTFSGPLFNEKIAQFRRMDQELTQLAKTETFYRLAARVPNFSREAAQSSEVGILQRAIRSGGRGVSIRRLFEQIPNLLPRLCPCMLMSPISAAQYLDPKREPFDIVIFDEASQLPTCKAVGALARGRNAVIVGDPKQMPPTSFFSGNTVDEENLEQEDLESILEDCLALNMPQTHLLWHYRSRHESLIAFSNSKFYENKLYTFPSVNDLESKVTLVHVDGFFDRGKTRQNRAEAEAIVRELQRRCHDPACEGQSVGVVTFNINQQNLIDDLLTEACKTDAGLEAWAYEREEALFIKNLENVQGDERDVILFSIGYGPDAAGRVTMNFGPLNREGGWRRLNVAVSRARQEMVVFATLTPDQIDLSRTSSAGVAALKAFLEYAGGEKLAVDEGTIREQPPYGSIAGSICTELQAAGYECRQMIGHSNYRVDVGVVDPKHPDNYLLGVLLDGPIYGTAKTTRDREVAQLAVLRGLGWELHRIWTADWWDNRKRELDRLLGHIRQVEAGGRPEEGRAQESAMEEAHGQAEPAPKLASAYQVQKAAPTDALPSYRPTVLLQHPLTAEEYLMPSHIPTLKARFAQVLRVEAPISENLLTRRVLQSVGIARAGSRIQAYTTELLKRMRIRCTVQDGMKFYWNEGQDPDTYDEIRVSGAGVRDAKDVPVQEAANAVCHVLKEQIGLPREDLIREAGKLLGYTRSGSMVVAMVQGGIQLALKTGRITPSQDGYLHISD